MLRKSTITFLLALIIPVAVWAQTGTIKGSVKDAVNGEAIVGASIYIAGTQQGAAADIEGNFEIPRVKAGTYKLVISFVSYKTDTLSNITVYPDQITVINTTLQEESLQLSEVVVAAQRVRNTDVSVISDIKTSQLVVAGISAQQISLSQDRDAAQIVRRIPGITIVDGRFVNVRGLSERYNTVLLNGIIAPSTEVDSRAFSFDLIPSTMIDRMMVYKSGSPEFSGEFAGAVINIDTKSVVEENSLSVNLTTGVRNGTTFQDYYTHQGSGTDFLGFDNGFRQLPSSFPTQNLGNVPNLEDVSRSLPNRWATQKTTAAPDLRANINFTHAGHLAGKRFSNITSISYTNTRQTFTQQNNFYGGFDAQTQQSEQQYSLNDNRYTTNVRLGIITNFILELNPRNRLEFRNLLNQQGTTQTTFRDGKYQFIERDGKDLALNYFSRRIYSGQLTGKHGLSDRTNVSWTIAYSNVNANQPDYRNISSRKAYNETDYTIIIPPTASIQDGGRFFSDLNEDVFSQTANVDVKLNPEAADNKLKKVSVGYYVSYTNRSFDARWFAYGWSSLSNIDNSILVGTPFTQIFKPENIGLSNNPGTPPYFILKEGTSPTDSYGGRNLLTAGYVNYATPIGEKFRLATGVRAEYNRQQLRALATNGVDREDVNNPVMSVLPFVNLTYNYTQKSLVRIAYSKTVNRPVFRELAGFNFYDFNRRANFFGNPDLKTANIQNVDLRWETYPSPNESVSFGVFYKSFKNPIEQLLYGGSNPLYTYANADKATSYGVEAEVRKSLASFISGNFAEKFSVVLNAALIKSEVQYSSTLATNQERNRAMQGQSPYIVNAGLYYNDSETGLQANISYNVFGKRIYAVGDKDQFATQYEMPRNQIDLTISKTFGSRIEAKFGIQDLLNQRYRLIQDSNRDKKITGVDEYIQSYRLGQYFTFGVTYRIK